MIEAIYENGVLKPLVEAGFKEHQRYKVIFEEPAAESVAPRLLLDRADLDPELAAEIKRRTTVLPDGRKIVRLAGLFQADLSGIPDDQDPVAEALAELRRERDRHFDEEWPVPGKEAE
jgi:predicted DNA-binding antitoxin AbrB/MazE fold protein